jgi:hypothetical protein
LLHNTLTASLRYTRHSLAPLAPACATATRLEIEGNHF